MLDRIYQDTSREAYEKVLATLPERQAEALAAFKSLGPSTADEIAAQVGRSVLSVRPTVTMLKQAGLIVKTGERRPSHLGNSSIVWKLSDVRTHT